MTIGKKLYSGFGAVLAIMLVLFHHQYFHSPPRIQRAGDGGFHAL